MSSRTACTTETVLTCTVAGTAAYSYLPFEVPPGVSRLDLSMGASRWAHLGLGLFDTRGAGHASPGFRGITGAERREIFLGLRDATPGFSAGPIPAGRWTVLVPVFFAPLPTRVRIRVLMTFGDAVAPAFPEALPGIVRDAPGWYRGDLHCHTIASSDAWGSGAALTPAGWADIARALGLDFLAMTDHNVVSQNRHLARDAQSDVLLLAGEEVTNYFYGHATVSGIAADDWFDFRHAPTGLPLPAGGARIDDLVDAVRAAGGFLSAAHPVVPVPWASWQFLAEAVRNPRARPDGFEVWNGRWQLHNELALRLWHRLLRAGWAVVANGGSDLHQRTNEDGVGPGTPTTVVHASSLARRPLVEALRAGRSFVTRRPHGVQIFLTASGPGGQHTFTGGRIHARPGEAVTARVRVQRAGGMQLAVVTAHGRVLRAPVDGDDVTVEVPLPIGTRPDFVRVEVRRTPERSSPLRVLPGGMEAFTNPIRLLVGAPPPDTVPEHAPPPSP